MCTFPDSKPAKRACEFDLIRRKDSIYLLQNFFGSDRRGLYTSALLLKLFAFALTGLRYWSRAGDIELRV